MADNVKVESFLKFDVKEIAEDLEEGVLDSLETAAKTLAADAERRFLSKTQRTGTGEMERGFLDFKSKFKDGGWIAGAWVKGGDWDSSAAGHAHFFEYGRSEAGAGKAHGGPQPIWIRRILGQPPRPFMRPAKNMIKRKLKGITGMELRRVIKKMNSSPQLASDVMRAVNKL